MFRRLSFLAFVAVISNFIACGPPSLEEITSELDTPSAELNGHLISSGFKSYDQGILSVKMPSMGKFGKMVSFLKVDDKRKESIVPMKDYLVQSGIPKRLAARILPYLPVNNDLSLRKKFLHQGEYGTLHQALPLGDCVSGSLGLLNSSFSVSVDLACAKEGSGRITIVATAETSLLGSEKARFKMEVKFHNACNKEGYCVDGGMLYKVGAISGYGISDSELKLILSMKLQATSPDGAQIDIKQGIRVSFAAKENRKKVEVLVYVKDKEGNEKTLVIEVSSSSERGSFSVRGAKGQRVSCQTSKKGLSGKCFAKDQKGSSTIQW